MNRKQTQKKFCLPFTYRIYASETVVYDYKGKHVVGCPTEQEAIEFINGMTEDVKK